DGFVQAPEAVTLHAGHAVVRLQAPLDDEERAGEDWAAILLERRGIDDDVADAGLVLEGEEDEALGGAGTLADDAEAGSAHAAAAAEGGKLSGGMDAHGAQALALQRHRMRPDRHPCAAQICRDAVAKIHLG